MFDNKSIEAFKSLKASKDLKARVTLDCKEKRAKHYARYMNIAASVAVFVTVCFIAVYVLTPKMYINNEKLNEESISISELEIEAPSMQRSEKHGNMLQLRCLLITELSLSCGTMNVYDIDSGRLLYSGKNYFAHGNVAIQFNLANEDSAILKINSLFKKSEIKIEK